MIKSIFLIIHIITGSLALITGGIAAFTPKGQKSHILMGRSFVGTMVISSLAGVILSLIGTNIFLLAIGLFSLYLT